MEYPSVTPYPSAQIIILLLKHVNSFDGFLVSPLVIGRVVESERSRELAVLKGTLNHPVRLRAPGASEAT